MPHTINPLDDIHKTPSQTKSHISKINVLNLMIAIQALFLNIDYIVVSVILKVQKSNSDTKFETNRLLKYNLGRIPEVAKG